jgi:hypothetical protein
MATLKSSQGNGASLARPAYTGRIGSPAISNGKHNPAITPANHKTQSQNLPSHPAITGSEIAEMDFSSPLAEDGY